MDSDESKQLKDLITAFRECKTAKDEKHLIQREKAIIRNSFMEKQEHYRLRNIAKLIWINMLGHETDFGQLECLNTISSDNFSLKKIGYLGLSLFFNEKSDVLLLTTNRIMIDLDNPNQYVVALALTSFCEISDVYMCETLFTRILDKTNSPQKYIKKKALLACMRVLRKVPAKAAELEDRCSKLLDEKNHGLMICGLELAMEIVKIKPAFKVHFHKGAKKLISMLKELSVQHSAEYDVDHVNDPFLQAAIIRFLFELCDDETIKDDFCALLSQVTVNLQGTRDSGRSPVTSNSCHAILFECVRVIMVIDAPATVKKIGISVLSTFLTYKEVNSKYIALRSLAVSAVHHKKAVQKHLDEILKCLNDGDLSIRSTILDILKLITDETNIAGVTRTLFNDMLSISTAYLKEMTPSVCQIIELNASNKAFYFDSMLKVMSIAGNYVGDESVYSLVNLVIVTPEMHAYALYKLYYAVLDNQVQEGLVKTLFWLAGEFCTIFFTGIDPHTKQSLPKISESQLVELMLEICKTIKSSGARQITLNSLMKIEAKVTTAAIRTSIKQFVAGQTRNEDYECQTRAYEYNHLLSEELREWKEDLFKPMPAPSADFISVATKELGTISLDDIKGAVPQANTPSKTAVVSDNDLLGIDLLSVDASGPGLVSQSTTASNPLDLLEIRPAGPAQVAPKQTPVDLSGGLLDFGLTDGPGPVQTTKPTSSPLDQGSFGMLDLMSTSPAPQTQTQKLTPLSTGSGQLGGSNGLDLLGGLDITPSPKPAGITMSTGPAPSPPPKPVDLLEGLGLGALGVGMPGDPYTGNTAKKLDFIGYEDPFMSIRFLCSKINSQTVRMEMIAKAKNAFTLNNFKLAISAAKYLTMELGHASGNVLASNGSNEVRQVLTTVNSQQGQKPVLLQIRVKYDSTSGQSVEQTFKLNQQENLIPVDF